MSALLSSIVIIFTITNSNFVYRDDISARFDDRKSDPFYEQRRNAQRDLDEKTL